MARLLATTFFWLWMTLLSIGALLVVVFLYVPYVMLKALWFAVTGRLHETTAIGNEKKQVAEQSSN
ncbi:MAG: hypothetical protein AAF196_03085 [Planctomycetota bacterium]